MLAGEVVDLGEHPRRRPAERVLVGELDSRTADVLVGVVDIDVSGPVFVRDPATARASGACSGKAITQTSWPAPMFEPTSTARRA